MLFSISLIVAVALSFALRGLLKKYSTIIYIACAAICVALFLVDTEGAPAFLNNYVFDLIRRGALGTALFVVVMYIGALKNGSKLMKMFMPVRGQLSILASILCLCHNAFYGKTYFVKMITMGLEMPLNQFLAGCITIVLLIIMIPLFITSFPAVRKTMKGKTWKKLQRFAYAFYGLLYVHIMLLMVPFALHGKGKYVVSIIVYSLVYGLYGVMRLKKSKLAAQVKRPLQILFAAVTLAVMIGSVVGYCSYEQEDLDPETETTVAASSEAGSENDQTTAQSTEPVLHDGVFTGSGTGYNDKIEVSITIENGQITEVVINKHKEDAPYMAKAEEILQEIINQQTYKVDNVSGATSTCVGIKSAVKKALKASMEAQ